MSKIGSGNGPVKPVTPARKVGKRPKGEDQDCNPCAADFNDAVQKPAPMTGMKGPDVSAEALKAQEEGGVNADARKAREAYKAPKPTTPGKGWKA